MTRLASTNGALSGRTSISMSGANFGNVDLSITSVISISVCETSVWVSSSGVVCSLSSGSGVGSVESVRLSLSGAVGTASSLFSYDSA